MSTALVPSPTRRWLRRRSVLSPLLVVVLLGAIAVEKALFHSSPADASAYHLTVQEAVASVPLSAGDWDGTEVEVTPAAITLLRPNVIVNRTYRNRLTGEKASLLLVQCRDARDLLGHFPPFCYPARGYLMESVEPRDWRVGSVGVQGKRYRFTREELSLSTEFVVDNFMLLSSGETARDMGEINRVAQDMEYRFFGAAQFQVLTAPGISEERRDAVLREIVSQYLPVIEAISTRDTP